MKPLSIFPRGFDIGYVMAHDIENYIWRKLYETSPRNNSSVLIDVLISLTFAIKKSRENYEITLF
jgi:hypothetical protein